MQAVLISKSKDWLAWNHDVSESSKKSAHGLFFPMIYHYKNPTEHVGLVQCGNCHHHRYIHFFTTM